MRKRLLSETVFKRLHNIHCKVIATELKPAFGLVTTRAGNPERLRLDSPSCSMRRTFRATFPFVYNQCATFFANLLPAAQFGLLLRGP